MGSLKRKMLRRQEKAAKKKLKKQLSTFGALGEECSACAKEFDKKSREHAETWRVVVRKDKNRVSLFCPDCWDKAKQLVDQLEEE